MFNWYLTPGPVQSKACICSYYCDQLFPIYHVAQALSSEHPPELLFSINIQYKTEVTKASTSYPTLYYIIIQCSIADT